MKQKIFSFLTTLLSMASAITKYLDIFSFLLIFTLLQPVIKEPLLSWRFFFFNIYLFIWLHRVLFIYLFFYIYL